MAVFLTKYGNMRRVCFLEKWRFGLFLTKYGNMRTVCFSENGRFLPKYGRKSSDIFVKIVNKQTNPFDFFGP